MKTNGTGSTNQVQTTTPQQNMIEWAKRQTGAFEAALPKGTIDSARFMQSVCVVLSNPRNAQLANCTAESIGRSIKEAACYGLDLNPLLGQAYLIPYKEKGVMTCHFQMGYKGLIALARRSKTIKTIAAEVVYENDDFEVQLGVNRTLTHKIDLKKPRGKAMGYYCLVELENGGFQFAIRSKEDVELHRDKFSKTYSYEKNNPDNIWNKNFDEMAKKTCVIQALKLCPISIEALEAVSREELADIKDEALIGDFEIIKEEEPKQEIIDVIPENEQIAPQGQELSEQEIQEIEQMYQTQKIIPAELF